PAAERFWRCAKEAAAAMGKSEELVLTSCNCFGVSCEFCSLRFIFPNDVEDRPAGRSPAWPLRHLDLRPDRESNDFSVDHAFAAARITSITTLGLDSIGTWLLSTS